MKRAELHVLVCVLLAALLLWGCGGGSAPAPPAPAAGTAPGGASSAPAVKEVKIGNLLPFSGPAAPMGEAIKRGLELAVKEINAAGGIKSLGGAKIKMIYGDTQAKPEVAAAEAERLILQEKVDIINGALRSADTLTATTVAEKNGVPFITANGTADSITDRGYKWLFRFSPRSSWVARDVVRFIQYLNQNSPTKATKVALIWENSEFGQSNAKYIRDFAKGTGLNIIMDEGYSAAAPDLTPLILKVKAAKPDVVVASSTVADATQIINGMAKNQVDLMGFIGIGSGYGDESIIPNTGKNVNYLYLMEVFGTDIQKPEVKAASEAFKKEYGIEFTAMPAGNYAVIYVLADALERAGSLDKEKIRTALRQTNITLGQALAVPQTAVKFGEDGQAVNAMWFAQQYIDGKLKTVWPDTVAPSGNKPVWPVPKYADRK